MNNDMGKVTTWIKVVNWDDLTLETAGVRREKPRALETNALVDTGATKFYLKASIIQKLGLRLVGEMSLRTMSNRLELRRVFSPVALDIQGRVGRFDVVEVPDSLPNIIGQIPLEDLDWVVDCKRQQLIQNPEHPDGPATDALCESPDRGSATRSSVRKRVEDEVNQTLRRAELLRVADQRSETSAQVCSPTSLQPKN